MRINNDHTDHHIT